MAAKVNRRKADREPYNEWIKVTISEPTDQFIIIKRNRYGKPHDRMQEEMYTLQYRKSIFYMSEKPLSSPTSNTHSQLSSLQEIQG